MEEQDNILRRFQPAMGRESVLKSVRPGSFRPGEALHYKVSGNSTFGETTGEIGGNYRSTSQQAGFSGNTSGLPPVVPGSSPGALVDHLRNN